MRPVCCYFDGVEVFAFTMFATLYNAALAVMSEPDVNTKAAMTFDIVRAFQEGSIPIMPPTGSVLSMRAATPVPDKPARPVHVTLVDPRKRKGTNTLKVC
ncbi:MAG: hypothetical protein EOO65_01785 [Methanosarcinales archaeon]|nr:MAG: hypothetical protein EOO65_01785 [Methanosarcinales archaeon]